MYRVKCEDCDSLTGFNFNPFFKNDNTQVRGKGRGNRTRALV